MNDSIFLELERLVIGDTISVAMRQVGTQKSTVSTPGVEILTIPSGEYAHPHILRLVSGRLTFIQLTIPDEQEKSYHEMLDAFGSLGLVYLPKTQSAQMYGYPDKGHAFIVNGYSGKVLRVQKFPIKPQEAFIQEEGKNYVPNSPAQVQSARPVIQTPTSLKDFSWIFLLAAIIALCILFFIIRKIRRKRRAS